MNTRKIIFLVICCVIAFAGTSNGDEGSIVLDSLIRLALNNNPGLTAVNHAKTAALYKAEAVGILPDPKITMAALNLPKSSLSFDETPMSGFLIGLTQSIPWPSKLGSQGKIADLKAEIEATKVIIKENSLIRMVKESYYEYSFWNYAEQIIDDNIDLTNSIISIAEVRYANGKGSAGDILRAQTALSRMRNKELDVLRMKQSSLLLLNQLTGKKLNYDKELKPIDFDISSFQKSGTVLLDEIDNPNLRQFELQVKTADKSLSLSRSGYWPDLMLGIDYRIRKDHPMDAVGGEDFLTFKVGFQLPLYFFKKQNNKVRSAQYTLNAIKAYEQNYEFQIERQISDMRLQIETIEMRFQNYISDILPLATAAYESTRFSYEAGKADFDRLLLTQKDLLEVELEKLNLAKSYFQLMARYNELIGADTFEEKQR